MTVEITIQVPDTLGKQLEAVQDRLPEVLERGLRDLRADIAATIADEHAIIAMLTSQPTPEQVLAIQPSPELQARVGELQMHSKQGTLSPSESAELDRYLLLEHLVRMAKARVYQQR